jgi:hypothetical protein
VKVLGDPFADIVIKNLLESTVVFFAQRAVDKPELSGVCVFNKMNTANQIIKMVFFFELRERKTEMRDVIAFEGRKKLNLWVLHIQIPNMTYVFLNFIGVDGKMIHEQDGGMGGEPERLNPVLNSKIEVIPQLSFAIAK